MPLLLPAGEPLVDLLANPLGKLGGRMDVFEVERHRLPSRRRLRLHLVKDACLSDPSLSLHPQTVPFQDSPNLGDERITTEDVLDR